MSIVEKVKEFEGLSLVNDLVLRELKKRGVI